MEDLTKSHLQLEAEIDALLVEVNSLLDIVPEENPRGGRSYGVYSEDKLTEEGYNPSQIEEIQLGIRQELDVEHFAKECYNWMQMQEIRLGLLRGVDTEIYENQYYSAKQMREIRLGLQAGLDVTQYARLMYSATDMAQKRHKLSAEQYNSNPTGYARTIMDEESGIQLRFSDDCMEVYGLTAKQPECSAKRMESLLRRHDVTYGVDMDALEQLATGEVIGQEICVAKGQRAVAGRKGSYEFFFRGEPGGPKILSSGKVDYASVAHVERVEKGTLLAKYTPATRGADGVTVTGIKVKGLLGEEQLPLSGVGFLKRENGTEYVADRDGCVTLNEITGTLRVCNEYVINGDINCYNGNVKFDGIIRVRGSVGTMVVLEAAEDIIVEGFVEGAALRAGRNIIILGGVNAGGRGMITAGGQVMANFFEAANVQAKGDVEGNYFLGCQIETDSMVQARGSKGRIMGGNIQANAGVKSFTIGNYGKAKTLVQVADTAAIRYRALTCEHALKKIDDDIWRLKEGRLQMEEKLGKDTAHGSSMYQKICLAIAAQAERREVYLREIAYLRQVEKRAKMAYIKVTGTITEGTLIVIDGKRKQIQEDMLGATFVRDKVK